MTEQHVCPVWAGYFLLNPIRKLIQNPEKILSPYVSDGMTVLDYGCAMGFFSIPLARMVGEKGKVICVDIQERMLEILKIRALKAGVSDRIETLQCDEWTSCLNGFIGKIDFALSFAVIHEIRDQLNFFAEISAALKPRGRMLVAEPRGRVSTEDFAKTIEAASKNGLTVIDSPHIFSSHTTLFGKINATEN
jgi:2-polyprenyl-3-methyl-5-hydroxy-6-metoxy-1,4-benzoquinol methylase